MGVCEELLPWDVVINMVKEGNFDFSRTQYFTDLYENHRNKVREEWRDINSYCKHRMLGYPCKKEYVSVANENGQVQRVVRNYVDDFAQCPGKRQFVMDNEFPYAFSPEILHKVIWSADELTPEEYHRCIEREYSTKDYDIVVFVNPVHRKSVRGVHHGHALLRKKLSA